jgi:hypothetical protein
MTTAANSAKTRAARYLLLFFFLFWCVIVLRIGYFNLRAWHDRITIRKALNAPDTAFTVLVNGKPAQDSQVVLAAMRTIHLKMSHHTYPTKETSLVILKDGHVLELTLARDSSRQHEYWIFWIREPQHSGLTEIGRIETPIFDGQ